jgi:hypothetical protein
MINSEDLAHERRLYLPQDENGRILNPTGISHVSEEDKAALGVITGIYAGFLSGNLNSLYVRGTTVRESNYRPLDIDTYAVTNTPLSKDDRAELNKRLLVASNALDTRIDDSTTDLTSLSMASRIGCYRCFEMKTQSLCIYGNDLSIGLPDFYISRELAHMLLDDIPFGTRKTIERLSSVNSYVEATNIISKQMKRAIRGAHLLILDRIGHFSRDVETCALDLMSEYPDQTVLFETFLKGAVGLSIDTQDASRLLQLFNAWYLGEYNVFLEKGYL